MSLKKQFDIKEHICNVTFTIPKDAAKFAKKINLTGEFNNWDIESLPMKKLKNGEFSTSIELKQDREYEFKYLINGETWVNEPDADMFVLNTFKTDNSVLVV